MVTKVLAVLATWSVICYLLMCRGAEAHAQSLNRITILGAFGPDGVDVKKVDKQVEATEHKGPLVGLQYQRLVHWPWSVEILVLAPATGGGSVTSAMGIGYSF